MFVLGFLGTLINQYNWFNISKDIFHFLKPILGIVIGYLFFRKIGNLGTFIRTIVICGFISALLHFLILVGTGSLSSGSINDVREFGKDNFLEVFALFFLLYHSKFQDAKLFKNKATERIVFIVLLLSSILYFSRTMIVVAIILLLTIYGFTLITKKSIKVIAAFIGLIVLFYAYLFSIKLERNKPGLEAFLYKVKNAPSELFKTKIDRENHKDLWDHWRGYEAKRAIALMDKNPSSYVFGNGHGSLVNLKFKAPLTGEKEGLKFISELHNGYPYVLYKTGLIGLVVYLIFLFRIYVFVYKKNNQNTFLFLFISAIGTIYLFTTLTITGIYNGRDIIIFILGALLFFAEKAMSHPNRIDEKN
ncbi:O-antigen ligase family protein [Flavobacterium silvaticum]|uniref:O-antigen ligase family protein n=1 Tax=Flavobacterium silvaticum TaxID=1852020 RepID=A0A972FS64_9FLAO|nr:O-antigen ligase family protein [Flavobacterium silvaticum]NMH28384.1 O-antigen ligase family protein [Flavobacterium silvaticum]